MLDPEAESGDPTRPAFMAPPPDSLPYHGFQVLDDVEHGGFRWGGITDFEREPGLDNGDAFIVAPDGSRAGLEWRLDEEVWLLEMAAPTEHRWGVYLAGVTHPMADRESARRNLEDLQPFLLSAWEAWARQRSR